MIIFSLSHQQKKQQILLKKIIFLNLIIGYKDFTSSAVLGYLENKKSFYYVQSESYGSFISWDDKREKK